MDIDSYFKRIGYSGPQETTLDVLREIHNLHPLAIPFENLDSFLAEQVRLDSDAVFDKLVTEGRGGYCFEQNRLLADMLAALGFEVSTHAARVVWHSVDQSEPPRTHMLVKVVVDGTAWIADVGFGGLTMTAPLQLECEGAQESPHESFSVTKNGDSYLVAAKLQDYWKPMYIFDLAPWHPADFSVANFFVATHPDSRFVKNLIVARPFKNGRHALLNNTYAKYSRDGQKTEKVLTEPGEITILLDEIFKIRLEGSVNTQALEQKLKHFAEPPPEGD